MSSKRISIKEMNIKEILMWKHQFEKFYMDRVDPEQDGEGMCCNKTLCTVLLLCGVSNGREEWKKKSTGNKK